MGNGKKRSVKDMKLSSLNKFKGKEVILIYYNQTEQTEVGACGIVEDVEQSGITVKTPNWLDKVPISDITKIELYNNPTQLELHKVNYAAERVHAKIKNAKEKQQIKFLEEVYGGVCKCQHNRVCCKCNKKKAEHAAGIGTIDPTPWHMLCSPCLEKEGGAKKFGDYYAKLKDKTIYA